MGGFSSLLEEDNTIDYNKVPFKLYYNEISSKTKNEYKMSVLNGNMISSDRDNILLDNDSIIFDKNLSNMKVKVEFRIIENDILIYKWISYVFIMENDLTGRSSTIWLPTGKTESELNQFLNSSNNIKFQLLFFPYGFFKDGEMFWNEFHWLYDIDVIDKKNNISIYNSYCCVKLNTLDGYKKETLNGNMELVNNLAAKMLSYQLVINQSNYIFNINNFENSKIFYNLINCGGGISDKYQVIGNISKTLIGKNKISISSDNYDPRSMKIVNGMKVTGEKVPDNSLITSIDFTNLGNGIFSTILTLSNELIQDGTNIIFTLEKRKKCLLFLDYYIPVYLTVGIDDQNINQITYNQDFSIFISNKLMLLDSLNKDNLFDNKYGIIEEKTLDNNIIHFYKLYQIDNNKKIKILDNNYNVNSDFYLDRIHKIKFDIFNNYHFENILLESELIYQTKANKKLSIWREINILSKKPLVVESDNKYKLIFKLGELWSYISKNSNTTPNFISSDNWKLFGYQTDKIYLSADESTEYQVYQYDEEFNYILIDNIEIYDTLRKVWTKKEESISRFRSNYLTEWKDNFKNNDDDFTNIFKISHYEEYQSYKDNIIVDINLEVVSEGDLSEYKIKI